MIEHVVQVLNSAQKLEVKAVSFELSPERKEELERRFALHLFSVLIPATDPLVVPHIKRAQELYERGSRNQQRLWKIQYRGKLSRLSWRVLPYHAATAALSVDRASLARFMEYTAKALTVHRSCRTSLRHVRKSLKQDTYHVWSDLSAALAALVRA